MNATLASLTTPKRLMSRYLHKMKPPFVGEKLQNTQLQGKRATHKIVPQNLTEETFLMHR